MSAPSSCTSARERTVERVVAERLRDPRRVRDDANLLDLDRLAGRLARVGVVLERRHEDLAARRADTEDAPVTEAGEERRSPGPRCAGTGTRASRSRPSGR